MKIILIVGHLSLERGTLYYDLIEDLSENHVIKVFTGYPSRGIDAKAQEFYINNPVYKFNSNVTIYRIGSRKDEGKNLITRMVKYLILTNRISRRVKKEQADILFISSTPPFFGYLSKKFRKKMKVIYNAQDLFPDSLISHTKMNEKNLLVKILRNKEKQVYKYSDLIITISSDMKKTILSNYVESNKIIVIKNWVDIERIKPVNREDNVLFDMYKFNREDFYISYGGNIGVFQNWPLVIEIMKVLKDESIYFVIFGDGTYKEKLKEEVLKYSLNNVTILPMQPNEMISSVYSFGDIELVPLSVNMTKYAYPSKTSQILSAGNCILGLFDKDSEISNEINNNFLGFAPNKISASDIASYILNYKNGLIKKFEKNYIRNYAIENYSRSKQTQLYEEILNNVNNRQYWNRGCKEE